MPVLVLQLLVGVIPEVLSFCLDLLSRCMNFWLILDGVRSSVLTYSNVTVAETCKDIGTVCTDSDPDSDAQNICGVSFGTYLLF